MPAWVKGSWVQSKVKLQDYNAALRSLLTRLLVPCVLITSHSAKASMLSWACWAGIPPADRSTLGYHKVQGQSSMRAYSRDALLHPLHQLMMMLAAYRCGKFKPGDPSQKLGVVGPALVDSAPSVKAIADGNVVGAGKQGVGSGAGEASASASSSSEEPGSMSGSEVEVRALVAAETLAVKAARDGLVYENRKSFMIHLGREGSTAKFMCKRSMNKGYTQVDAGLIAPWKPRCSQCHGAKSEKKFAEDSEEEEEEVVSSDSGCGVWV